MIAKGLTKFVEVYVLKRGVLDGVHGLIAAVSGSYFAFLRYALVWEATRNTQRDASRR
jgi:hypothetical protein